MDDDLRGNEAVLLVEDEASVRAPIARTLRRLGYHVLEAKHGEHALTVLHEYHAPIHLLLTDLVMPEMGGGELARQLHSWYPNLRMIFISGYSEEMLVANGAPGAGRAVSRQAVRHGILGADGSRDARRSRVNHQRS